MPPELAERERLVRLHEPGQPRQPRSGPEHVRGARGRQRRERRPVAGQPRLDDPRRHAAADDDHGVSTGLDAGHERDLRVRLDRERLDVRLLARRRRLRRLQLGQRHVQRPHRRLPLVPRRRDRPRRPGRRHARELHVVDPASARHNGSGDVRRLRPGRVDNEHVHGHLLLGQRAGELPLLVQRRLVQPLPDTVQGGEPHGRPVHASRSTRSISTATSTTPPRATAGRSSRGSTRRSPRRRSTRPTRPRPRSPSPPTRPARASSARSTSRSTSSRGRRAARASRTPASPSASTSSPSARRSSRRTSTRRPPRSAGRSATSRRP